MFNNWITKPNIYPTEHFIDWVSNNRYDLRELSTLKEIVDKYESEFPNKTFKKESFKKTCGGCPMIFEGVDSKGADVYIRVRHGHLTMIRNDYETVASINVSEYGIDGVCSFDDAVEILEKEGVIFAL